MVTPVRPMLPRVEGPQLRCPPSGISDDAALHPGRKASCLGAHRSACHYRSVSRTADALVASCCRRGGRLQHVHPRSPHQRPCRRLISALATVPTLVTRNAFGNDVTGGAGAAAKDISFAGGGSPRHDGNVGHCSGKALLLRYEGGLTRQDGVSGGRTRSPSCRFRRGKYCGNGSPTGRGSARRSPRRGSAWGAR